MAQKRKRKKNKKRLFWFLMLILLVVAAVVVYFVWDGYFKGNDGGKKESSQEVEKVEERIESEEKSEEVRGEEEGHGQLEDEVKDGKEIVQYDGENPNKAESISGVVTYAGVSGERLMIRVNIDQFLDDGECILNLVRNGSTIYNDTARVVGNVATATCEGFDVPVDGIGRGATDIMITINSGEKTGAIAGKVEL